MGAARERSDGGAKDDRGGNAVHGFPLRRMLRWRGDGQLITKLM
jgi:hypothetical protein